MHEYVTRLDMQAHIEGGYYRELYRSPIQITDEGLPFRFEGSRALSTTICFLLESGQWSKFHRLKFDEIWFYHDGCPMLVHQIDADGRYSCARLGLSPEQGEQPQLLITAGTIFGAEPAAPDSFCLVSCMVSPGFDFRDFELFGAQELLALFPAHAGIIQRLNGDR